MSREELLSKYEIETKDTIVTIKMENADIDQCYELSEQLEQVGMKFKAWLRLPKGFELIMKELT